MLLRCLPWSLVWRARGCWCACVCVCVCSAGPAGCFYKGGDPLQHTHAQIDNAGLCGQCSPRHCAIWLVCGAEVGLGAAAGPFLKPLPESCCVAARLSLSPLCCQSVRKLTRKSRGLAGPAEPRWEPCSQFPTCSRSRKWPDAHSQSCQKVSGRSSPGAINK